MNKKEASGLVTLVSNKATLDSILEYIDFRVGVLKDSLVFARDMETVHRAQGAIEELKRFKTLRDEVLNAKE